MKKKNKDTLLKYSKEYEKFVNFLFYKNDYTMLKYVYVGFYYNYDLWDLCEWIYIYITLEDDPGKVDYNIDLIVFYEQIALFSTELRDIIMWFKNIEQIDCYMLWKLCKKDVDQTKSSSKMEQWN